jgi:EmrB/QacA subfamily drug resistance transporter
MSKPVASLALAMLLPSLGTSIANAGLPVLAEGFEASFHEVQWIVLAYLLAITTLIVGVGRLGDIMGRRRLLLAGILVFTLASLACGLAPTLGLLIAARAVQGAGAAIMMALTMAFVGEVVPKERTGSAMGLLGTMSAIGTAAGPSLGGVLISGFGWRAMFLVIVPLGAATLVLAHRHLPRDRRLANARSLRFDKPGTLLLALTLAAYALAVTIGPATLLLAAAAGAALFVLVEANASSPLIRLALFRDRALTASLATSALVATVMMATLVVGPFHLAGTLGLDAITVGLVLSVGPLVAALAGVPAGRIADRYGTRRMTTIGLVVIAAGCAMLAIPVSLGLAGYLVPIVILTIGYAMFQTANTTAVMADLPADRRGVIAGLLNLSRNLGLVTGASVMGAIFALAGIAVTFAIAAVAIAAALAIDASGTGSDRCRACRRWPRFAPSRSTGPGGRADRSRGPACSLRRR